MTTTNGNIAFKAGDVELREGRLCYKGYSIAVDDIAVMSPYNTMLSSGVRIMGSTILERSLIKDSVYQFEIKIAQNEIPALFKAVKECGTAPMFSDKLKLVVGGDVILRPKDIDTLATKDLPKDCSVWCYDEFVIISGLSDLKDRAEIKDIRFFKTEGKKVRFGYEHQYTINKLSKEAISALKEELIKLGAPIGAEIKDGTKYNGSKPWFGLKFWVRDETLTIAPKILVFNYSKGSKSDSIFLPIADVTSVLNKGSKLYILGKQNIISKSNFGSKVRKNLKAQFAEASKGYTGKSMFSRFKLLGIIPLWERSKKGRIDYSDKGLLISPSKVDLEHDEQKDNPRLATCMKIDMENVMGYYRKGKKFFIVVNTGNIRYDDPDQLKGYSSWLAFEKMTGAKELASKLEKSAQHLSISKSELKNWAKKYKF
ncbi:MAG: hypothetical protein ACI30D_08360 [Muribaculaceae bacterium]